MRLGGWLKIKKVFKGMAIGEIMREWKEVMMEGFGGSDLLA